MWKTCFSYLLVCFFALTAKGQSTNKHVILSKEFISKVRNKEFTEPILTSYKNIDSDELVKSLNSKEKKLAFWYNTYNAFVIHKLQTDPDQFEDKGAFYKTRNMNIAGIMMSFDDIEHGIIRNNRCKFSYGYWGNPFTPDWVDTFKNTEVDGRAHFSLNCGAKSCPPVTSFDDTRINEQMDVLTKNYLEKFSRVEGKRVYTSALFGWFRGDFGGFSGIKEYLVRYGIIPEKKGYKVIFGEYDWTLMIDNFSDI